MTDVFDVAVQLIYRIVFELSYRSIAQSPRTSISSANPSLLMSLAEALSTGTFSIEFGVSGTPRQQTYRCKGSIVVVRKCVFVNELLTHRPDYCRVIINSVFHDMQTGIVKTSTPVVTTSKATPQSFLDS